jgi:hypothetical protein
MSSGLREKLSPAEFQTLRQAMEWVIPTDSTPGAGSDACIEHLVELVGSLGEPVIDRYAKNLPSLKQEDLANTSHPFAPMFIDHVRDVYYAYADTGAWADIGFEVTG